MSETVVIVGGGEAGGQVGIVLRQSGWTGRVIIVGDEPYAPYERPPLSKTFLAGVTPLEKMYLRDPEFYAPQGIELALGVRATAVDRAAKTVMLSTGEKLTYSKLVMATGGRVRRLTVTGADLTGIHYLRTIDDVLAYRDRMAAGARVVIVGGGYIGLEVAAVAVKRGCAVTVLEALPLVLNRVVAAEISRFYMDAHRTAGVAIHTSTSVSSFAGSDHVTAAVCGSQSFPADLVIVGIGIVPNIDLAVAAGLEVDNGIVVDAFTKTSDPDIYAVGDCSNHPSPTVGGRVRLESVHNALAQGKTAALHIAGKPEAYNEVPWFWSDQYDLKLQMTGLSAPGDTVVVRGAMADRKFSACYLRDGRFVACNAVNMAKDFIQSKKLIAAQAVVDPVRLADPSVALKDLVPAA